jgi:hypothetical protein
VSARKKWTPEVLAEVAKLRADGLLLKQVAYQFGVSQQALSDALRRAGIARKPALANDDRALMHELLAVGHSRKIVAERLGVPKKVVVSLCRTRPRVPLSHQQASGCGVSP